MIWIVLILIVAALPIFFIAPSGRHGRMAAWKGTAFAHRGLHGADICENTLEGFDAACRAGFGIELDVQLSADGEVVVFHDDDLERLCGDTRRVDSLNLQELRSLSLPCGGAVPAFREVLECVDGRVPLLVELKNGGRNRELCEKTLALLRGYKGRYIIESFNPLIVFWFRKNARDVLRGQLVTGPENYMPKFGKCVGWILSNLMVNVLARPDFIAYDVDVDFAAPGLQRKLFSTPMACWTVKSQERFREAIEAGEMPIFEGFLPEE